MRFGNKELRCRCCRKKRWNNSIDNRMYKWRCKISHASFQKDTAAIQERGMDSFFCRSLSMASIEARLQAFIRSERAVFINPLSAGYMHQILKIYWDTIWCPLKALALEITAGNWSNSQEDCSHGRNPCKGFWIYRRLQNQNYCLLCFLRSLNNPLLFIR